MNFEPDYLVQTLDGRIFGLRRGGVIANREGKPTRLIELKFLRRDRSDFDDKELFFVTKIHRPGMMQHDESFDEGTISWSHIKKGVSLEFKYTDKVSKQDKSHTTQPIVYLYRRE